MRILSCLLCILFFSSLFSQNPGRLKEEVVALQAKYSTSAQYDRKTVVFTGSSTIRFWEKLQSLFPEYRIVNTGFGGSMASDLLVYLDDLILKFNPQTVFIYEGDNDIEKKKSVKKVFRQIKRIADRIHKRDSTTTIVLIGVKPCPARWHLRDNYRLLNEKLRQYSEKIDNLEFAAIWDLMLIDGQIRPDIYLEDGLHLNEKGYLLLHAAIKPFL